MENVPLMNKGKRTWEIDKNLGKVRKNGKRVRDFLQIKPGKTIAVSAEVAEYYAKSYPKDFEAIKIEQEKPKNDIHISDTVKDMVKEIDGVGMKTVIKAFTEGNIAEEAAQIEYLEKLKAEKEQG